MSARSRAALGALTLMLPACGWDLGPTEGARRFTGTALMRDTATGAVVAVRSDDATFSGDSGPVLFTCNSTGPRDLALRNWRRYLRFSIEDPAGPAGSRALFAGGPWCLVAADVLPGAERSAPVGWCAEYTTPDPLPMCPALPDPVPCNVGIPAPPGTPHLAVDMPALGFGSLPVGAISGDSLLTLRNSGGGLLCLGAPALGGSASGDFTLDASDCAPRPSDPAGTTVLSSVTRASCGVRVRFAPSTPGARAAQLQVSSSDAARPRTDVGLSGTGQAGTLAAAPSPVCFNVAPAMGCYERSLTLTNSGPGRVTINSAATPAAATDWSVVGYTPLPPLLRRNTGQSLTVRLRTCRPDATPTVVTVNSDATNAIFDVPLLPPASGCTP